MTTAQVVITDALGEINESGSEVPIQADDEQLALRMMNNMVASWNLPIGYTTVTNPSQELTVIDGAILAIQKNLAVLLMGQFDYAFDSGIARSAKGALAALRRQVVSVQPSRYPSRLPTGSGNDRINTF